MANVKVHLRNDGIVYVEYPVHAIVTISDVQDEYEQRLEISNEKALVLVRLHGVESLSEQARTFVLSPEFGAITEAAAVVVDPTAGYHEYSRILLKVLQSDDNLPFEVRIFDDEESALQWLRNRKVA